MDKTTKETRAVQLLARQATPCARTIHSALHCPMPQRVTRLLGLFCACPYPAFYYTRCIDGFSYCFVLSSII